MTPEEVIILARYVRALAPQQRFDEYTPDAWGDILAAYRLEDARAAAARIAARQPFISPSEIVTEIRAIRGERLDDFRYEPQPGDDDPAVYLAHYRQQRAAVANGTRPPVIDRAITGQPVTDEFFDDIGRPVPAADKPTRRGPLGVKCPKCGARLGRHCKTPHGVPRAAHAARKRAATGQPTRVEQTAEQQLTTARNALAALTADQLAQLIQETNA